MINNHREPVYTLTIEDNRTYCVVHFVTFENDVQDAIFIINKYLREVVGLHFILPISTKTQVIYKYEGIRNDVNLFTENTTIIILQVDVKHIFKPAHKEYDRLSRLSFPFEKTTIVRW